MNVASKEVCCELYRLSGWWPDGDGRALFSSEDDGSGLYKNLIGYEYSLGWLLGKLPWSIGKPGCLRVYKTDHSFVANYGSTLKSPHAESDTPEDALCQLAIQLFKQNILTK